MDNYTHSSLLEKPHGPPISPNWALLPAHPAHPADRAVQWHGMALRALYIECQQSKAKAQAAAADLAKSVIAAQTDER